MAQVFHVKCHAIADAVGVGEGALFARFRVELDLSSLLDHVGSVIQ